VSLSSSNIVPNNVPDKYKEKLIKFIKYVGGVFATMYYKPLRTRIVTPENFITMYIILKMERSVCRKRVSELGLKET